MLPPIDVLERKLAEVHQEVCNLTVMGMDPKETPDQLALIRDLERSARAELCLRWDALEYAQGSGSGSFP
jgi:hypothetical protein